MYVYYSRFRPVSIGTYPPKGMISFDNFDKREYIPAINKDAWARLVYDRKLTNDEMIIFDLEPHPNNFV